jgi:hypothetical protein
VGRRGESQSNLVFPSFFIIANKAGAGRTFQGTPPSVFTN